MCSFFRKWHIIFVVKDQKSFGALRDDIFWISKYIPDVEWYKVSDDFPGKELYNYAGFGETEEFIFADPSTADRTFNTDPTRIMSAKYGLVGLDHRDWADYFKFNRNKERKINSTTWF